ncbi:MAG: MarR family transcriptional regulator [Gammaproteobacteria bacterium]|nr:MAG: MarR family transcriptional regulator [Gammaproteobacteria bacterium]
MKLTTTKEQFILHWGEMGTKWGVNRSVSQIHALLFIVGKPMHAEEIATTLALARSNVSNSIKELQNWQLVHTVSVLGDRREHFATDEDVWVLLRTITAERQRREIEPTVRFLQQLMDSDAFNDEDSIAKDRIRQTHQLVATLSQWMQQMMRLPSKTLVTILQLGAKIQKLLPKHREER